MREDSWSIRQDKHTVERSRASLWMRSYQLLARPSVRTLPASHTYLWKRRHGQLSIHSLAPEEKNRGDTIDHWILNSWSIGLSSRLTARLCRDLVWRAYNRWWIPNRWRVDLQEPLLSVESVILCSVFHGRFCRQVLSLMLDIWPARQRTFHSQRSFFMSYPTAAWKQKEKENQRKETAVGKEK